MKLRFATFRLGKTSVNDIKKIDELPVGVQKTPLEVEVKCTQVPEGLSVGAYVFVWLGSDNSKGKPTTWKQGFKAFGRVTKILRGKTFDDETVNTISVLYIFADSISRLDILRCAPLAYYWCSALPVIGIDDHSNQTVRLLEENSPRMAVRAFFSVLATVCPRFKGEVIEIDNELARLFDYEVRNPCQDVNLRAKFEEWMVNVAGKSFKTAKDTARVYVPSVSDLVQKPTKHIWHGLREVLYGKPAPKKVYEVSSVAELRQYYSGLERIFGRNRNSEGFDANRFERCWNWAHDPINHNSISAGWSLFVRFMEWRERQNPSASASEPVAKTNRLTVALKLFERARRGDATNLNGVCWTYSPGEQASNWDEDLRNGTMALDWHEVNRPLTEFGSQEEVREALQTIAGDESSHKNGVLALWEFCNKMKPGDLIFAKKGTQKFIAVGRVMGEYEFHAEKQHYQHVRKVDWFRVEDFESEESAARKTLTDITGLDLAQTLCTAYGLDGESGWMHEGRSVNGRIREYFDSLTEERIAAFSDEESALKEFFCHTETDPVTHVVFEHMWSGKNGQGWGNIKPLSAAELKEATDYLVRVRRDASVVATFLQKDAKRPKGFGPSVVSELLMKFHPESCIKHGSVSRDVLQYLELAEFSSKDSNYTEDEYKIACGAAASILARMKEMHLSRQIMADGTEDVAKPDYLTVNEFIWFVNENKDLIKEKVMEKSYKNAPKAPKTGKRSLKNSVQNDEMMQRLMAALRTKPFAILAGHSGTGKSQLVRRLAYMTCNDVELLKEKEKFNAPGNYCMVQVKPNWHDSTDLLGYYTEMNGGRYHTTPFVEFICKAYAYPETPFFVCLDEMNLAPVEQYFAEFLSAIESYSEETGLTDRLITEKADADEICGQTKSTESLNEVKKHGLTIPRNLFVVGTVNVDETTCQFSRKVLDRAMTILMNEVKFDTMTAPNDPSQEDLLDESGINFFLERPAQSELDNGQMKWLDKIQKEVGSTSFAIAYRFANEYALYQAAYQKLLEIGLDSNKEPIASDATAQKTAIDHVVLMKLLPRIHGTRGEVERLFKGQEFEPKSEGLVGALGEGQSVATMRRILERRSDYLTFWP